MPGKSEGHRAEKSSDLGQRGGRKAGREGEPAAVQERIRERDLTSEAITAKKCERRSWRRAARRAGASRSCSCCSCRS